MMSITSIRRPRYSIGDQVVFYQRGVSRSGLIVGRECAEHRRGYRACDHFLYLVRADDNSKTLVELVERDIVQHLEEMER